MLAVGMAEGERVGNQYYWILKARKDMHHFFLYFTGQSKSYDLIKC
jgi:hypothetical protein